MTALEKRSNARRNTVKARLYGGLLLIGLIKIGISLAGYSTDFWSSYVAFEKAAGTK